MAVHYFLVYYILQILTPYPVTGQAPQYGRQGFETTLNPSIAGTPEKIQWKYRGSLLVEFDGSEEKVYGGFQNRVVLDWHTAALTIRELLGEDSGPYELEATINKRMHYSHHNMEVIDKVAEPTISCVMNSTSSSPDASESQATLVCSAEGPPSLITFDWTFSGVAQAHAGSDLSVSVAGKHDDTVYSCRVSNPVSEETAEFTAKDCYPDDGILYIALITCAVIVLLILLLAECFWCYRKWKKVQTVQEETSDVEKQPWNHPSDEYEEGEEREALLSNRATLPSSQPLALLARRPLCVEPLDTSAKREEGRDHANSNAASPQSMETKLSESHSSHFDNCNEQDSICGFEEPSLESESNKLLTSSPVQADLNPTITELDTEGEINTEMTATQSPLEKRQEIDVNEPESHTNLHTADPKGFDSGTPVPPSIASVPEGGEEETKSNKVACNGTGDESGAESDGGPQAKPTMLPSEAKEVTDVTEMSHHDDDGEAQDEREKESDGGGEPAAKLTEQASDLGDGGRDYEGVRGESGTSREEEQCMQGYRNDEVEVDGVGEGERLGRGETGNREATKEEATEENGELTMPENIHC